MTSYFLFINTDISIYLVVAGCVAMARPPRMQLPGVDIPVTGPDLPETLPPGLGNIATAAPVTGYTNIVHFDLDPQNSMWALFWLMSR